MTGEIKYDLWSVKGTIELEIIYTLKPGVNGEPGIGEITVKSDEEPDIDEEQMHEIISLCLEDAKAHGLENEIPDLKLAHADFPFSVN